MRLEKHVIWDRIASLITNNWAHFSLARDKLELIKSARTHIIWVKSKLENKHNLANEIIKFLNRRTKEKLIDLNVKYKTNIIINAKNILNKRRQLHNVESRLQEISGEVSSFKTIFKYLIILGLPPPWEGDGDFIYHHRYSKLLEQKIKNDKRFDKLTGGLLG
jgi:hypothetical protein